MKKNSVKSASGISWDLSDLYKNIDDPQIAKDKKEVNNLILKFNKEFRTKINTSNLKASLFLKSLQDLEKILSIAYKVGEYASLLHSKDTKTEKIGKFYQETNEYQSQIRSQLLWYELGLVALDNKTVSRLLKDTKVAKYSHYIKKERIFKPFRLSEREEMIMTKKAQTSDSAFVRLFDEIDASNTYNLKLGKEVKKLSGQELSPYLASYPVREVRENAAKAYTTGLQEKSKLYTYILNTLLLDKKIDDEIRGYKYPQQATFLSYEIDHKTVETMTKEVEKKYSLCEKFYLAKRKITGSEKLHEWDRYSVVTPNIIEKKYSWDEAVEIVLDVYGQFSPVFKSIAEKFINNRWVDAEITPGKRGGAFCSYATPNLHPYVFVNFSGTMRDVETLAHELGHGIHAYLSRDNSLLQYWPSTAVAEIASVFGEMVTFEMLYKNQSDKKIKLNMLGDMLQSNFATIFRQNAFYLFEADIHEKRRQKGELSTEDINNLFQTRLQSMFGKGLTLTEGHRYWWMPVLHFYHYNFYVFSYSFGQMLTLALYARYKQEDKAFVADYTKALSLGGSKSPYEITKTMGIDINHPDFWKRGLKYLEEYVNEFINLASK